jgi:non-specific serine/threonine protein kinase/serine/threonine-protein kinase
MATTPENWKTVKELFEAALDEEPARRLSFLQERCSDGHVRAEVERLLAEHEEAGKFLSAPAIGELTADEMFVPSKRKIDSYYLLELIGEGGMGEVWLAEQKEPVRRRVAIKLIKAGMDTREVVARFESERQALALMDHPAIAKVFDAGSTPQGRPYFVMEYVAGTPITTYCDRHKLNTRQRLELFVEVCEGVQHAHQKAIIHRDLKPSNILVSEVDGKPMPRIIDFGLAKATSQRLTDASIYTRVGAVLGTLDYMSPEQADSGGEDIDTRTDVYSLGVVLYQLLTGALPLDLKRLAHEEMLRRLREQDVSRPSSRILTRGGDSAVTAQNRSTDPPTLMRQLRGDPDAVVLKALEKDRRRRYGSPSQLAEDIGRYLRNEPITAHAPSARYRARKYIRRHRLGVAMAGAAVLLLAGAAITEAVQLKRITQERNRATQERDRATRERGRADRMADFMMGIFQVSNPYETPGHAVTARDILDNGAKEIGTRLSNDPELQARMMSVMGYAYNGLGEYSRAQSQFEGALEIRRRVLGAEAPDTAHSMFLLAANLALQEREAEAEKLLRKTLEIQRRIHGPEDPETLTTMSELAASLKLQYHSSEAEELYRKAYNSQRRIDGPEDGNTLYSMSALGSTLGDEGRYAEGEKLLRESLDIDRRVFGEDDWNTMFTMACLSYLLRQDGRYEDAEKLNRENLEIHRRVLGPEHPHTAESIEDLAVTLSYEGRYDESQRLFREAVQTVGKTNEATAIANAWYSFACGAAVAGHHDQALGYLRQAIELGYTHSDEIAADPDLKSLRGDPRFDALLARARQAPVPRAQ